MGFNSRFCGNFQARLLLHEKLVKERPNLTASRSRSSWIASVSATGLAVAPGGRMVLPVIDLPVTFVTQTPFRITATSSTGPLSYITEHREAFETTTIIVDPCWPASLGESKRISRPGGRTRLGDTTTIPSNTSKAAPNNKSLDRAKAISCWSSPASFSKPSSTKGRVTGKQL